MDACEQILVDEESVRAREIADVLYKPQSQYNNRADMDTLK